MAGSVIFIRGINVDIGVRCNLSCVLYIEINYLFGLPRFV